MKIAITGCSSSIGKEIIRQLKNTNHEVFTLGRQKGDNKEDIHFDLNESSHNEIIGNMDCVIHCAWNLSDLRKRDLNTNVKGTEILLNQTNENAQFIFISSLSAFNPKSIYGQLKSECENFVIARGGIAIRCGLIWGDLESGILKTIRNISRIPFICLHVIPDMTLFQSHDFDIAKLVLTRLTRQSGKLLVAANPEPVLLSEITHALNRKFIHVKIKLSFITRILTLIQRLGVLTGIRLDSFNGDLTMYKNQIIDLSKSHGERFTPNTEFFDYMNSGQI
jgi:dTDP-4-dehydrorhamnose reductase